MAWGGSFVFNSESGKTEQQEGSPKKEVGGGSFVFNSESGKAEQQEGSPKKEVGGGSFVFNKEAAPKQQQGTSEVKQETKPESPKLWEPASAQQSDPPRLQAGRTKEDLYELYKTIGSSAQEMSLKDMVERPKRPVRKNNFKPTSDRKPEGGTGAGGRGRKNHNQHHHRPNVPPSKTNVTVPPRANANQTPEKYRPSKSFGDFLQDDNSKKVGKESETLPRSRSAQTPETSLRGHNKTVSPRISPRIVIPELPSRSPRSPMAPTKSPKASFIKPTSGNQQPPRSKRMSPGPSPLSSPRPRRSSAQASVSWPARLGLERELASSPRVAQEMGGASPLASWTPRRTSVDRTRSPSPARLGYEREPWSIDGVTPALSPSWGQNMGSASPLGTPRRSFVGQIGSPLGSVSSPARLGYEREPWSLEEMQSPMRRSVSQRPEQMYSSTASPFSSHKSSARPARRASHSSEAMDSKSTDDKSSSLGDFFGRIGTQKTAAPTFQEAHQTIRCRSCSSYTLMKTRCLVCGKIYCRSCVKDAMGDMPEGRKCTNTCVGRPLHSKYKNDAGKGCFWIPRASKIVESKLARQENSTPTPMSMRSNNSNPRKHSTNTPNQSNKARSKFSNRTPNQNMRPRMSISSNA